MIGKVELTWRAATEGEIGYLLHPDFRGNGYAREAADRILQLGFEELHKISARCDPGNEPSRRLLERLGMRREGERAHPYTYAMLAGEYRTRSKG